MTHEVMQVSPLPLAMLKALQEEGLVLHDHSHILDPAALARVPVLLAQADLARIDAKLLTMLPQARRLVLLGAPGTPAPGVEWEALAQRGVEVSHTPPARMDDAADLALALLLSLTRRVLPADRFVRNNDWVDEPFACTPRFSGSRLGLVGMGPLAQAIARRAQAFDVSVAYTDAQPDGALPHRHVASVEALAAEVDHLVIADSQTAVGVQTVTLDALRALGPTGQLVHLGAPTALDLEMLAQALKDKVIAGAAVDVFADAPRVPAALRALPQVLLTPQIAHATLPGQREMVDQAVAQLKAFFAARDAVRQPPTA